jgi:Na+/melibiose symporter-like transporter
LHTGRRSEGLFFSAVTFIRKCTQGFGLMAASLVLWLAQFPTGATTADVGEDALWRLGAWYVPAILCLWLTMMAVISTYRLDRAGHEENLRQLAVTRNAQSDAGNPA